MQVCLFHWSSTAFCSPPPTLRLFTTLFLVGSISIQTELIVWSRVDGCWFRKYSTQNRKNGQKIVVALVTKQNKPNKRFLVNILSQVIRPKRRERGSKLMSHTFYITWLDKPMVTVPWSWDLGLGTLGKRNSNMFEFKPISKNLMLDMMKPNNLINLVDFKLIYKQLKRMVQIKQFDNWG